MRVVTFGALVVVRGAAGAVLVRVPPRLAGLRSADAFGVGFAEARDDGVALPDAAAVGDGGSGAAEPPRGDRSQRHRRVPAGTAPLPGRALEHHEARVVPAASPVIARSAGFGVVPFLQLERGQVDLAAGTPAARSAATASSTRPPGPHR